MSWPHARYLPQHSPRFATLATIGGALLVKRGIISDGELQELIGYALVIIPAAYGMWPTHRDNKKAKVMADEPPDTKALV